MQDRCHTGNTVVSASGPTSSMRMAWASRIRHTNGKASLVWSLQSGLISGNVSHPAFMAGQTRTAVLSCRGLVCRPTAQHGCNPGAVSHAAIVAGRACARALTHAQRFQQWAPGSLPRCQALPPGCDHMEPDCRHAMKSNTLGHSPVWLHPIGGVIVWYSPLAMRWSALPPSWSTRSGLSW